MHADDILRALRGGPATLDALGARLGAPARDALTWAVEDALAGYDGGAFANNPNVDACFVVRSQSVHRIQESQALLGYQLWLTVHDRSGDEGLGAA